MRKRCEETPEKSLHCLDDEMEMAFKLEAVGREEGLEELAKVCVDVSGTGWSKRRAILGAHDRDIA